MGGKREERWKSSTIFGFRPNLLPHLFIEFHSLHTQPCLERNHRVNTFRQRKVLLRWSVLTLVGRPALNVVPVELPERLPLLGVQEYVGPALLHERHGPLRRPSVLRHEVAPHQGGAAGATSLAVHVHAGVGARNADLIPGKTDTFNQHFIRDGHLCVLT